jgi:hypothetical protein
MNNDSSHLSQPQALRYRMMLEKNKKKTDDDDDEFVNLRVRRRTKKRLALQGTVGETFDAALHGALDRLETCHCRPLRRVTQ